MGVLAGALQGLLWRQSRFMGQRLIESGRGCRPCFGILLSSVVQPGLQFGLLAITVLFGWMSLVGVVRAEFFTDPQF